MKKLLIILGIVVILVGLAGAGYWYWQNYQAGTAIPAVTIPLEKVALDKPDMKGFDKICQNTYATNLECTGNIEQFNCHRYFMVSDIAKENLNPAYPIIQCERLEKDDNGITNAVSHYIIIDHGFFKLIATDSQLREVFQPINTVAEAQSFFSLLGKGLLVLDEKHLAQIKSPVSFGSPITAGKFDVPLDTIQLSQIKSQDGGFTITAYSGAPTECVGEVDFYTFFLQQDGTLTQKSSQVIWEMPNRKSACSE